MSIAAAETAPDTVTFVVPGIPATAGSKRGFMFRSKTTGKVRVAIVDDAAKKGAPWRAVAQLAAKEAWPHAPLEGPLALEVIFRLPRPKGHFGKRGLRPGAPVWPAVKPDLLKYTRLIEDALTALVWRDDAQIVVEHLQKRYVDGETPGAMVTVRRLGGRP